jgi:hypothetical protein
MVSIAQAESSLYVEVQATYGAGAFFYAAGIRPTFFPGGPADVQFTTGRIASEDNQSVIKTDTFGWAIQGPTFHNFNDLLAFLQQPWEMLLDEGLPTERNYTMALNLGSLPTMDLTPPIISFPTHMSTIDTLTPTFTFTTPAQSVFSLQLGKFLGGTSDIVASTDLSSGQSTWSPQSPLTVGSYYLNISRNNIGVPGLGFSTPIDTLGDPFPNWHSGGTARLEANALFSVVPEPTGLAMLAAAFAFIISSLAMRRIVRLPMRLQTRA